MAGKKKKPAKAAKKTAQKGKSPVPTAKETGRRDLLGWLAGNFPVYFVLVCCVLYAVQLGIATPESHYQKAAVQILPAGGCGPEQSFAYARGERVLLPVLEDVASSVFLEGSGAAAAVETVQGEYGIALDSLRINGVEACAPCFPGRQYPLAGKPAGVLFVEAVGETGDAQLRAEGRGLLPTFFQYRKKTSVEPLAMLAFSGGWKADSNRAMPSSFYGIDAPFHINRVPLLAGYLSRGAWPSSGYTFLSALPPALIYMASGVSHQYAFKIWEILLFFAPIGIFWLFSGKLAAGKNAAFLLSSLIYLYLPANGLPVGGGPDLFFYGMTAHVLGTYLSLLSFYFAYSFGMGGRRLDLALAAALFALASLSNPRILLPEAFGLAVVLAIAAAEGRWKRGALLAIACAASVAWFAIPYAQSFSFSGYAALEGVAVTSYLQGAAALLQAGFVVLPLLLAAGAYAALKRKEAFPLALAGWAMLVFVFTSSPEVNGIFPFVDGLRFLPSFFLPAMFVAGIGAHFAWEKLKAAFEWVAERRKEDKETLAVAFGLALLLPLALLAGLAMHSTARQYASSGDTLAAAYDYDSQELAYSLVGKERALFVSYGEVSQWPAFESGLQRTVVAGFLQPPELSELAKRESAQFVVVANSKPVFPGEAGRDAEYAQLKQSPLFEEVLPYGGTRLFALKRRAARGDGIAGFWAEEGADFARLGGNCIMGNCSATVFVPIHGPVDCLLNGKRCAATRAGTGNGIIVGGIPGGKFGATVSPGSFGYEWPLRVLCAIVLAACLWMAGKK